MRTTWIPLALAALAGCHETTGPAEQEEALPPASAYVNVIDEQYRPLRPDTVVWYYPEDAGQAAFEHPATCINAGCTRWSVPVEVHASIYVWASRMRPVPGVYHCCYLSSDARLLTALAASPPTVTLTLNTKQEACE